MDAGEEPPHALESRKSPHALSLVVRNKRIVAVSSGSSRLLGCRNCFAREQLRNCPLGRAFAFAGLLAGAGSERRSGEEFFMP